MKVYEKQDDYAPDPCPNCGAEAEVEWADVGQVGMWSDHRKPTVRRFVPLTLHCSAQCWLADRDGYQAAVDVKNAAVRAQS